MIINDSLLSTLFRLINFGLLLGVFAYLFKRYFLATIKEGIAQQQRIMQELHEYKSTLLYQQEQLQVRIEEEKNECVRLKEHVLVWKEIIDKKFLEQQEAKEKQKKALRQRIELKKKQIVVSRMQRELLPEVLTVVREQIKQKFDSQQAVDRYFSSVMHFIEQKGK